MNKLPEVLDIPPVHYDYFPTTWQAVVWRNWGYVPISRIARAVQASEEEIRHAAYEMGLEEDAQEDEEWLKRGYLTIIRNNWHLCTYEQILTLLDITDEQLAFILKEEDFMWVKLGSLKPNVEAPRYTVLSEEQKQETAYIKQMKALQPVTGQERESDFSFIKEFSRPLTIEESDEICIPETEHLRMIYPYFALYGDVLIEEGVDLFPDRLLAEYAKAGINGIWMQGMLYQLVEFPFEPSLSKGYEIRVRSLNRLVEKAKQFGIGVYLYLNEPRSMPDAFFQNYPELRGQQEGEFYAMCTSTPQVQKYLQQGMKELFTQIPGLAGYFTITMSENLTNCYSRVGKQTACLRCNERTPWEVVAEVNNLMAKGAHEAAPNAKAIAWSWGWKNEWAEKVIPLLTEGQIVQCTSEEALAFCIGGVQGSVLDYTISRCGPGEKAKTLWEIARQSGHEASAKVQLNNSWELAAVPYIPVFDKIAEHIEQLKKQGVKHLQASWTLGGCPSPNLSLVAWLMADKGTVRDFMWSYYGEDVGEGLYQAQRKLSEAFSEFPFHIDVLYYGPQNFGPMAPFFMKKTSYHASMVGYPYDDLDGWRGIYPADIYGEQMKKLCIGFREGLAMMQPYEGRTEEADALIRMTQAALCHFESTCHHIDFVANRGDDVQHASEENRKHMLVAIQEEKETVQKLIMLRQKDSRIGYESSNHYFYTLQDLNEKLLNLDYCERNCKN